MFNSLRSGRMAALLLVLIAATPVWAQKGSIEIPHRQDAPPNDPYSPQEALARMTVPEGFTVELVASEPDIVNPTAMTFDDRGRIWITESLEYPRKSAGKGRDRVKILEDTTGDGRADKVTVFADDLNIPTGIAVGHGGVWVMNAPDLLFFREENGKAVSREVVLTGFGRTDTHELPNSLTWGPDGWLYGLNGVFNHSRVESEGKVFDFTCAMYRIHPQTHKFELFCEGTSNPWGVAWDPEGSAIISTCHWAKDHVFHFVETGYYQRQAGAYPPYTMKIGSISDHGHQMTAYCGFTFFDSDAYPEQYRERFYTGNIHGGCVNVDRLRPDGSTYIASGEPDFLHAGDVWFMPVAQHVGPDGCLYVLDWYDRYHCSQDAFRDPEGVDRLKGRLYRVRYQGTPRAKPFDMASESDEQLIERLGSANIFYRERAQRLLTERNSAATQPVLASLVLNDSTPRKARLHALWSLVGTGQLEPDLHRRLLEHPDSTFRAWGVRAAGNFRQVDPQIAKQVAELAADPSPDVKLQVAIAAPKMTEVDTLDALVTVAATAGHDKLLPYIVWPNLHPLLEDQADRFVALVEPHNLADMPALATLLPRAVDRVFDRTDGDFSAAVALVQMAVAENPECAKACLAAVADKREALSDAQLQELKSQLRPTIEKILASEANDSLRLTAQIFAARLELGAASIDSVREVFVSEDQPAATRLQALDALIVAGDPRLPSIIGRMLTSEDRDFLVQMLPALGRLDNPRLGEVLLEQYPSVDPQLQPMIVDLLMQRQRWTRRVLEAIEKQELPRDVLNANHLRQIMDSNDRESIWKVEDMWGNVRSQRNPRQEQVVAEMETYLRENPGDPLVGETVFQRLCIQCHTIYDRGHEVGPDLTTNGRASFEQLISNVFDPSLVIGDAYQVRSIVTHDGRMLSGIVTEDSPQQITLKMQGGREETVARNNIKYTQKSELSMMPEGVEQLFDRRELADLFAFLSMDKHPTDETAQPIAGAPDGRENVDGE
ncbi:MAG: PVC-type heme-binding CxxCH protein [Pirellulales bacterium]